MQLPIEYWKRLDDVLREKVPVLYTMPQFIDPYSTVKLSNEEIETSAMILNNVKLYPKNLLVTLPDVSDEKTL